MSDSFLVIAFVAAIMIAFWRVTILITLTLIIATIVSGLTYVGAAVALFPH